MKLIMKANELPNEIRVTEVNASKEYILRKDGLRLRYTDQRPVHMLPGVMLLQSENSLNVITGETELAVHFKDLDELLRFTRDLYELNDEQNAAAEAAERDKHVRSLEV